METTPTPICIAHRRPLTAELCKPVAQVGIPAVALYSTTIWAFGADVGLLVGFVILITVVALLLWWEQHDFTLPAFKRATVSINGPGHPIVCTPPHVEVQTNYDVAQIAPELTGGYYWVFDTHDVEIDR